MTDPREAHDTGGGVEEAPSPSPKISTIPFQVTDEEWAFAAEVAERVGAEGVIGLLYRVWSEFLLEQGYVPPEMRVGPEYEVIAVCPWCRRKVNLSLSTVSEDSYQEDPESPLGFRIIRVLWHGTCAQRAEERSAELDLLWE